MGVREKEKIKTNLEKSKMKGTSVFMGTSGQ